MKEVPMLPISEAKEKLYNDLAIFIMSFEEGKITKDLLILLMEMRIDLYKRLENG